MKKNYWKLISAVCIATVGAILNGMGYQFFIALLVIGGAIANDFDRDNRTT